ncbi:hypothetical protein IQ22_03054 [Pseudomonas duriflava]|uniref:Uncharacterized protein n=1 Tax=Pseudomonas duriflava TaxID=459528 RepID=A0A562Q7I9_9PSED|nr:hypothetical protein [Pseudomonas duriflava]TWI52678.1 hypothetical protein IQ22_03054 [Pseudomonas duriflava]
MTVSDLIKALEQLDPDLFLITAFDDSEAPESGQKTHVLQILSVKSEFLEIYSDSAGKTCITSQTIGEAQEVACIRLTSD